MKGIHPMVTYISGLLGNTKALCLAAVLGAVSALPARAEGPIAVFPEASYDAFLIYESLAVFWIAIICLLVILRMKIKEIERTQTLGLNREDEDAPLLT